MSKYDPLTNHLCSLCNDTWPANFRDVEAVLGFRLPDSARTYDAWWSNNRRPGRQNNSWLDAGWQTDDLNIAAERVTFRRDAKPASAVSPKQKTVAPGQAPSPILPTLWSWDVGGSNQLCLGWEWTLLGAVTADAEGRPVFPKTSTGPAIYRLRIRLRGKESRYIGEAENLGRRFGNYRRPGPTQQTSLRINGILKDALAHGAEIAVAAIQSGVWLEGKEGNRVADLSSKVIRGLFENAVICAEHAADVETLNRAGL